MTETIKQRIDREVKEALEGMNTANAITKEQARETFRTEVAQPMADAMAQEMLTTDKEIAARTDLTPVQKADHMRLRDATADFIAYLRRWK
jgi:hypothetical protein